MKNVEKVNNKVNIIWFKVDIDTSGIVKAVPEFKENIDGI